MAFITQEDAAEFLYFISTSGFMGPVNIHSGVLKIEDLITIIEDKTNKQICMGSIKTKENRSPYGIERNWYTSKSLSEGLGFDSKTNLKNYIRLLV